VGVSKYETILTTSMVYFVKEMFETDRTK